MPLPGPWAARADQRMADLTQTVNHLGSAITVIAARGSSELDHTVSAVRTDWPGYGEWLVACGGLIE